MKNNHLTKQDKTLLLQSNKTCNSLKGQNAPLPNMMRMNERHMVNGHKIMVDLMAVLWLTLGFNNE